MADFQLEQFTQRSNQLLDKTRGIFDRYGDLIGTISTLPQSMEPADGAVKLVFIGQYSAGKSSLIKMLTGIDTGIGSGITTNFATTYPWHGIEIVDTPGIHTDIRADHDARSYREIERAALLIFVVTNEGFGELIGDHFRKLAIDQKRGRNMVLVVNKMDRAALGNVEEQQKIIADDMLKVIAPYTPSDLFMTFVSTEMYFEGVNESDPELKQELIELSGCERLIENLNRFAASRGVLSKIQAPLETLKTSITNAVGDSENMINEVDLDAVEELFNRKKQELDSGRRRIESEIVLLADACAQRIRAEGSKAASVIDEGVSEEQVRRAIEAAQLQSEIYVNECETQLLDRLKEVGADVDEHLLEIDRSPLSINVCKRLNIPVQSQETFVDRIRRLFEVPLDAVGKNHIMVNMPTILKLIGYAFSLWKVINKILGTDDEKKMRQALEEAKRGVISSFDEAAVKTKENIISASMGAVDNLIAPIIRDAEEKLNELRQRRARLKEMNNELSLVLTELDGLMDEVQTLARPS